MTLSYIKVFMLLRWKKNVLAWLACAHQSKLMTQLCLHTCTLMQTCLSANQRVHSVFLIQLCLPCILAGIKSSQKTLSEDSRSDFIVHDSADSQEWRDVRALISVLVVKSRNSICLNQGGGGRRGVGLRNGDFVLTTCKVVTLHGSRQIIAVFFPQ